MGESDKGVIINVAITDRAGLITRTCVIIIRKWGKKKKIANRIPKGSRDIDLPKNVGRWNIQASLAIQPKVSREVEDE